MTERANTSMDRLLALLASLHVEIAILIFCIVIYMGTGTTQGPVFDVVGPELLPVSMSLLVGALVLIQIIFQIARARRTPLPSVRIEPLAFRNLMIFSAATILFVFVVAQGWLPFALATCAFMTVTTIMLSNRLHWRDAAIGAVSGLALGIVLQLTFTYVLYVDLPG